MEYLDTSNFPAGNDAQQQELAKQLERLLGEDLETDFFDLFAKYQRVLADNSQRHAWSSYHHKLDILFRCGKAVPLDGPMIGVTLCVRDSEYFRDTANLFDRDRSLQAGLELMATAWNMTFGDTGLWMGKTFEPVSRGVVAKKTANNAIALHRYDPSVTKIGRNFFRPPFDPNLLQSLGLPVLTEFWHLKPRPQTVDADLYPGEILAANLDKEKAIAYTMTGGIFLADRGRSVVPTMRSKKVYQLNYRWPLLAPAYPLTRLIDELVCVADGIYLGQLVFATKNYSLGDIHLPFGAASPQGLFEHTLSPDSAEFLRDLQGRFAEDAGLGSEYGYQNNGFFLMLDPLKASRVYEAFPWLRPHPGEAGYDTLGGGKGVSTPPRKKAPFDWQAQWRDNSRLRKKFTQFLLSPSPCDDSHAELTSLRQPDESILQMLQRLSATISAQTNREDTLRHFEPLNALFRCGMAPSISDGAFCGHGSPGFNTLVDAPFTRDWYGQQEPCLGFNYYHGATLNLHCGFVDTFCPDTRQRYRESQLLPSSISSLLDQKDAHHGPDLLNIVWAALGRFVFPWAGKSFEKISGRKLSMLVDESDDLEQRYPERVNALRLHLASAPHYRLVEKNRQHYWTDPGVFAPYLAGGSWDRGMDAAAKEFWNQEAANNWVFGNNIEDERILAIDPLIRIADMNYHVPEPWLEELARKGPSPFVRQGYIFLGVGGRQSLLPMNNGPEKKKEVFQFHYRYPMIGGPAPIGLCLDEIVEIADGLFLGQLIYATDLSVLFHSSVDSDRYKYQLFGYFLLMDNEWQHHRLAIDLDVWQK